MIDSLQKIISSHGHGSRIISLSRLGDLKRDLHQFAAKEELNQFQTFIINNLYNLDKPHVNFPVKSILIIAVPMPAYAHVEFTQAGRTYLLKSLVNANNDSEDAIATTSHYLKNYLEPQNYHIQNFQNLPLKRLAVRSGLAEYGRNNICYVKGMGSFLTFVAYFTDIEHFEDNWNEIKQADMCSGCNSCITSCPTGAIKNDRFLIDNERCLSYFNEGPGEFPEWIPLTAHNCVYDCLHCQLTCPMNTSYSGNVIGPIQFNEQETHALLSGQQYNDFNRELQKKVRILGMDKWLNAIPRNLKTLFEVYKH